MNTTSPAPTSRAYRQSARADAAAATHRRIVNAFIGFMQERWLDEITLEEVARAAEVTAQTVIRRFGGKAGLIEAASLQLGEEIRLQRAVRPGSVERAVAVLMGDYERTGDLLIRLLAEEPRHPMLTPLLDGGRAGHRAWVAEVMAPWLDPLPPEVRERRLSALVVATDVYAWKLLRHDMRLEPSATAAILCDLARGLVGDSPGPSDWTCSRRVEG
jgi:AcrR family transcriptional regulator